MFKNNALEFYKAQSKITDPKEYNYLFENLPNSIPELCNNVHGLISHRDSSSMYDLELTEQRKQEGETRYVDLILKRIIELDNYPLTKTRLPGKRFAGTCRDFAILLCTILRNEGIPARLRCGYAAYFKKGRYEDHWVCEYWKKKESRWVLVDAEVDDIYRKVFGLTLNVYDLPRDQFLVAGQAWKGCMTKKFDPDLFGVSSIGIRGIGFVRGNVVRDLAALNKVEMLPWDDWSISDKKFDELTKEEVDLIDKVAEITLPDKENFSEIQKMYQDQRLQVSSPFTSYTTYNGDQLVTLRE